MLFLEMIYTLVSLYKTFQTLAGNYNMFQGHHLENGITVEHDKSLTYIWDCYVLKAENGKVNALCF